MIFVVGAARSGTTLTTRILQESGATLGVANSLCEHMSFKRHWIYPQLRKRGYDRFGQYPIPSEPIRDMDPLDVRRDVSNLTRDADCLKDVKAVHFWPVLTQAFPEAVWVIVWRDPVKVARSCMRTSFMNAFQTEEEWTAWAETYHDRCRELRDHCPDRVFEVNVNTLQTDPAPLAGALKAIGIGWNLSAIDRAFRPQKWTG